MILFVFTIFNCKQDDIQDVDYNSLQKQKESINHFTIEDLPDIEHALNSIGSNRTGRLMTTTFGDLDLTDILHNQIGGDIVVNGSTNILQDVIQALTNGDLKYLNNQDPIECKATFNSQLIPTNL
ncbi:hypothetical protein [Xanthomarina sp. F2636L]|uniref:hypothetical protein n=1 Tax=Xanthomarina sp. F2636L TaxID=2996018 RepID=UPI00225DEC3B|nr:hypothetical protein [Xanthomarina sp. F2636L]MCX7551701.1 hypothetical protein [Xanthomarina sp. F2636L]